MEIGLVSSNIMKNWGCNVENLPREGKCDLWLYSSTLPERVRRLVPTHHFLSFSFRFLIVYTLYSNSLVRPSSSKDHAVSHRFFLHQLKANFNKTLNLKPICRFFTNIVIVFSYFYLFLNLFFVMASLEKIYYCISMHHVKKKDIYFFINWGQIY